MNRKKTSKSQFKIYLSYLKRHDILITGKLTPSTNTEGLKQIWNEMVANLNSCGDGPVRNIEGWKKVFREWKCIIRKKAREGKELNEIEHELIRLTGEIAVTGLDHVELGITEGISNEGETAEASPDVDFDIENLEVVQEDEERLSDENLQPTLHKENANAALPSTSQKKPKKCTENPLLKAYVNAQDEARDGMTDIANALNNIAASINRFCDVYERVNLDM
ncbi:uncharacterized protein LOC116178413 [Photinus pyralis]|uniref:uncharacterized protein LOC116178130 n=1 Tax=Photinus pyralis TaxID=7054 RepID=UPI0012673000|nr:uncharacterized protein LOC116178130 [Photinus pyralis]XP_031353760.1 uncharacterized protein LOC116178413 [Photinus pyralis]